MGQATRVLVVGPYAADREALADVLRADGHTVYVTDDDAARVRAAVASTRPALVIADVKLPSLAQGPLEPDTDPAMPTPRVILISPRSDGGHGAVEPLCLKKPIDVTQLLAHVSSVMGGGRPSNDP